MRDSTILRVVTALIVATWSPGRWCCCNARADAALEVRPAVESCDADACCEAPAPAVPAARAADAGDRCCPLNPLREPTCGCLHAPADDALAAAVATLPVDRASGADVDLLAALPPQLTGAVDRGGRGSACRGSPRRAPPQTLLSLHCLLTT